VILLGIVYWQDAEHKGVMPHDADTAMYGVELMIIICTTLAQSLCGESATLPIVGVLIFYRVVMGIGVGGDCKCILLLKVTN
jgi:PHS family inorganic phosphate transporter-like MFS transporter